MGPKDADGLANSVDPDQTAPRGVYSVDPDQTALRGVYTVWPFCMSKNSGSLQYTLGLGIDQFFQYDICIDTKWSILDISFDIYSNIKFTSDSLIWQW